MKIGLLLLLFMLVNACAGGGGSGGGSSSDSDVSSSELDLDLGSPVPTPISPLSPNPIEGTENTFIGPDQLLNIDGAINFIAPSNCEQTCETTLGCNESVLGTGEQQRCRDACDRDKGGLCSDLSLLRDPYTLTSFTVPAGYKKAEVEINHCTDRQDNLLIQGSSASYQTMLPGDGLNGNSWQVESHIGANVGRGSDCESFGLRDIARVKVRTFSNGTSINNDYVWKAPAITNFTFDGVIDDMDNTAATYVNVSSINGPGIKTFRIYDNYRANGQLDFLVMFHYWYDPAYTTKFDFYYKVRTSN